MSLPDDVSLERSTNVFTKSYVWQATARFAEVRRCHFSEGAYPHVVSSGSSEGEAITRLADDLAAAAGEMRALADAAEAMSSELRGHPKAKPPPPLFPQITTEAALIRMLRDMVMQGRRIPLESGEGASRTIREMV